MKAAIRDPNPVCVLENEIMYGIEMETDSTTMDPDFVLPYKAKTMRRGDDVTILSFGRGVHLSLLAADEV